MRFISEVRIFVILFFIVIFNCLSGFASPIGYLKIRNPGQNKAHSTLVTLKVNGKAVLNFSHASENDATLETSISSDVLARGHNTTLLSDYSQLQKGCIFDFRIYFSLDRQIWIDLGMYRAPSNSVVASLPIGICEDGQICSSNPMVKNQIEAAKRAQAERDRQNLEAIKSWFNQMYENELLAKKASENKIAEIDNAKDFTEDNFDAQIQEFEDSYRNSTIAEDSSPEQLDSKITFQNISQETQQITDKILNTIPTSLKQSFEEQGIPIELAVSYGWIYAAAVGIKMIQTGTSSKLDENLLTNLNKLGAWEKSSYFGAYVDSHKEGLRGVKYWSQAAELGNLGLRMSPYGDLIDFCEALTGREMCIPNRNPLSSNDRMLAAVGIIVGNRMINGYVEKELKTVVKEIEQVLDESGKIKWSKVFEEVESGDLLKREKTELIEQLRADKKIPKDWQVVPSKHTDGILFAKETDITEVRIMSGNPKSRFPNSQKPYVKIKKDKDFYDKQGNKLLDQFRSEAHIPLDEFEFK
jgi:hypothetical protein